MKKYLALGLGVMSVLLTGCPHNQYVIELTPRDKVIERELTFYREGGTNKDGTIKYETFLAEELAAISQLYPSDGLTHEQERHRAKGQFANVLPSDVGGAGSYTNLTTSLGSAGIYMERFRGDEDMAGSSVRRMKAIDEIVDLMIGWSRVELGREPHYEDLRNFLDGDFRKDLRNLGFSVGLLQATAIYKTSPYEEFYMRLGQYLVEHGYLKLQDWPDVLQAADGKPERIMRLVQRFVAAKLGVPETKPLPPALAFLADEAAVGKSWENYLATTQLYRAKIEEWEKQKLTKPGLEKPKPSDVTGDSFGEIIQFGWETDDHLVVKLSLPTKPMYTNGQWDEAKKQVVWEAELELEKAKAVRLPTFCCANWSNANESFQKEHFGKVLLTGMDLLVYCMWYADLNEQEIKEWESFLSGLKSGEGLVDKLNAFRFSGVVGVKKDSNPQPMRDIKLPRDLLTAALKKE